jgi:hypothetical protein
MVYFFACLFVFAILQDNDTTPSKTTNNVQKMTTVPERWPHCILPLVDHSSFIILPLLYQQASKQASKQHALH